PIRYAIYRELAGIFCFSPASVASTMTMLDFETFSSRLKIPKSIRDHLVFQHLEMNGNARLQSLSPHVCSAEPIDSTICWCWRASLVRYWFSVSPLCD